jgi:hypothetical protein
MTDNVIQYYHGLMVIDWFYTFSFSPNWDMDENVYITKKKEVINSHRNGTQPD